MSRIEIAPIEFSHKGTGEHTIINKLVVDPASVPGTGRLIFFGGNVHVRTMLFELDANVMPNWFGVAVPDGITDFTRPTIYFHPIPKPPRYNEATYFSKATETADVDAGWRGLFEYVERLGNQLAGAVKHFGASPNQVVILPFMPASKMDTAGILPANWLEIVTDILIQVRAAMTGVMAPLTVSELVLAGYSYGFKCMMEFRTRANQAVLNPLLKQIWDFDGFPKTTSIPVVSTAAVKVIKYAEVPQPGAIVLGPPRWSDFPKPAPAVPTLPDEEPELPAPSDTLYVHHLIRDFMFLDAAVKRG